MINRIRRLTIHAQFHINNIERVHIVFQKPGQPENNSKQGINFKMDTTQEQPCYRLEHKESMVEFSRSFCVRSY